MESVREAKFQAAKKVLIRFVLEYELYKAARTSPKFVEAYPEMFIDAIEGAEQECWFKREEADIEEASFHKEEANS